MENIEIYKKIASALFANGYIESHTPGHVYRYLGFLDSRFIDENLTSAAELYVWVEDKETDETNCTIEVFSRNLHKEYVFTHLVNTIARLNLNTGNYAIAEFPTELDFVFDIL